MHPSNSMQELGERQSGFFDRIAIHVLSLSEKARLALLVLSLVVLMGGTYLLTYIVFTDEIDISRVTNEVDAIVVSNLTAWSTQCEPPSLLFLRERGPTSPLSRSPAPCPAGYYFGLMPAAGVPSGLALWLGLALPLVLWAAAIALAVRSWRY